MQQTLEREYMFGIIVIAAIAAFYSGEPVPVALSCEEKIVAMQKNYEGKAIHLYCQDESDFAVDI